MNTTLKERFLTPGREYSPVPFWFLNGPLDKDKLRSQLADFAAHEVYGVVLHPRMGFDPAVPYLSDAFFDWIAFIVEEAAKLDMFVFLYDEGMYPSGSACGQVVAENPDYAARGLRLFQGEDTPTGQIIARIAAQMDEDGVYRPKQARLLPEDEMLGEDEVLLTLALDFSHGTIRGLLPTQDDGLPDAPPAADLLDADAVQCFIRLTHERYYARLAPHFGKTIRAMFTDEPNPTGRCVPGDMLAWTRGMDAEWRSYGRKLTDLPALFLPCPQAQEIRETYERLIQDRLLRVYYQPLRAWCDAHGIALTGHPAQADAIGLETAFTIPGQDLVWRWVAPGETAVEGIESTQAHCAADSMLSGGKTRCLDECFGCCGPEGSQWGMTIADMRWMMDYLFVRGVNMLAPHAFFYHMDPAISAQDRPPDVGPNNYWWPYFGQIARYIARMSAICAGGEDCGEIALLSTGVHLPWHLACEFQRRQLIFHYITLKDLYASSVTGGKLNVNGHIYRALVTPAVARCKDVRLLSKLKEFVENGLYILSPDLGGCVTIQNVVVELCSQDFVPARLTPHCEDIRVSNRLYGKQHVLMLFNEGVTPWEGTVRLPEICTCQLWDAWNGTITPLVDSSSVFPLRLEARRSVLIVAQKAGERVKAPEAAPRTETRLGLSEAFSLTLPDGTSLPMASLCDWQTLPGLEDYNGALEYTAHIALDAAPERAILDLGDVRELAEVRVNGSDAQALLLPPFATDIAPFLRPGDNEVTVRVVSSFVTRYEGKPWPCGLLGPVTLTLS